MVDLEFLKLLLPALIALLGLAVTWGALKSDNVRRDREFGEFKTEMRERTTRLETRIDLQRDATVNLDRRILEIETAAKTLREMGHQRHPRLRR